MLALGPYVGLFGWLGGPEAPPPGQHEVAFLLLYKCLPNLEHVDPVEGPPEGQPRQGLTLWRVPHRVHIKYRFCSFTIAFRTQNTLCRTNVGPFWLMLAFFRTSDRVLGISRHYWRVTLPPPANLYQKSKRLPATRPYEPYVVVAFIVQT